MPARSKRLSSGEDTSERRRDPYLVLGVSADATHREITSAYRKLALKYHPDKNANNPKATDLFKEISFSYNILSDPEKRRQYDSAGFEAVESDRQELELDLSSLGTVNTVFAALFSKLGVPLKTAVSATVLEDAFFGRVAVSPLPLGQPLLRKVDKHSAHFYSVTITEEHSRGGIVCRVQSDKGKFKLLYFEPEDNGGLSLVLQEDSTKTGKVTSAGMFFLGFPVCRLHCTVNSSAAEKDTDAVLFKKLDRFRPSEVTELQAGTHVFAVYGDNFFKSVSYTIEALCAAPFVKEKEILKNVEAQLLSKRAQLSKFESEHREVVAQYTEMTSRFTQEMKVIDNLLKQKNEVHALYTAAPQMKQSSSKSKKICVTELQEGNSKETKKSSKKWFNIHIKGR